MHSQQKSTQSRSPSNTNTIQTLTSTITTEPIQSTINKKNNNNRRRRKRAPRHRRLRRFNKKCIKRGLNEADKQKLMDEHIRKENINSRNSSISNLRDETMDVTTATEDKKIKKKSNKRKRLPTSVSARSISQQLPKKIKKNTNTSTNVIPTETNNKLPKYLKKAPNLLFQNLRLQLKKKLNKLTQKQFIYQHLQLLDQQYRLHLYQNLWQSYLTLGSEHQLWANQVHKLTKSNDHQKCRQFVINRLADLNRQYDQCTSNLSVHSSSCPSKLLPLDKLEHNLKEFVHLQQDYLSKKIDVQLIRYKDMIEEQKLLQILFTYNLTDQQKQTIERLKNVRQLQLNVFEDLLKLETQVSIEFLPEHFNDIDNYIRPHIYSPIVKNQLAIELKQKQYKTIQEAKRTWLNIYLDMYESQYQDYDQQYQNEFNKFQSMSLNNSSSSSRSSNNSQRNGIPLFNSSMAYLNHRTNRIKQEIYAEKIPIYRRKLLQRCRQCPKSKTNKFVNVSPKIIIDLSRHPFIAAEIDYLSRGPTYVRPNQSALRPIHQREKQIEKNINTMMNHLKKYMTEIRNYSKIPSTSPLYKLYSDRLRTYLQNRYMTPLSFMDQLRARRELKLVKSIRQKLKKYKLILRKTDKSGVFHIGRAIDYQRKAAEYRQTTGAYEKLNSNPFNETIYDVTHQLNQLKEKKKISESQRLQMIPNREKTELPYMYNLPKPHKKGTPLRPIMNTIHGATTKISTFLDKLIRPLFDKYVRQTTFVDGVDLLDKFQEYIQKGYFKSSTLFVTFDINNLYTMLPQEDSLKILGQFLHEHQCDRLNGIAIDTIIELARIVLQKTAFVHDGKFYRQIIGGAMGSPFTLTLANIFMWDWEKQTILSKLPSHELYGRYIDDVFFTWNGSEQDLRKILDLANKFHPNIKLEYQISKNLPFLDILLQNQNGILTSSVYHKPAAEPTILSFLSDHPRHIFRNCIQTALMRAIRYSTTLEIFNRERRNILLMLLYNSYPSKYIHEQFQQFFTKYLPSCSSSILSLLNNEQEFFTLREKLLAQPSIQQVVVTKSAATVDISTNIPMNQQTTTTIRETTVKKKPNDKYKNTIFIHWVHEARLTGLKRSIHEIHNDIFKNTEHVSIRLVVGDQNNPNLDFELTCKRPRSSLLKDPSKRKPKFNQPLLPPQ